MSLPHHPGLLPHKNNATAIKTQQPAVADSTVPFSESSLLLHIIFRAWLHFYLSLRYKRILFRKSHLNPFPLWNSPKRTESQWHCPNFQVTCQQNKKFSSYDIENTITSTSMTDGLHLTTASFLPPYSFRHSKCEMFSGSSLSSQFSLMCHGRETGTAEHCSNLKEPNIKEGITAMALILLWAGFLSTHTKPS